MEKDRLEQYKAILDAALRTGISSDIYSGVKILKIINLTTGMKQGILRGLKHNQKKEPSDLVLTNVTFNMEQRYSK